MEPFQPIIQPSLDVVLIGKPQGKRAHCRPRSRWGTSTWISENGVWVYGLDGTSSV